MWSMGGDLVVKSITFENLKELSDCMYIESKKHKLYIVSTVFYKDAVGLIKHLLSDHEDININIVDIEPCDFKGYDREYYISLSEDLDLSVEPAYKNDAYLDTECDVMLINENAHYNIVLKNDTSECIETMVKYN